MIGDPVPANDFDTSHALFDTILRGILVPIHSLKPNQNGNQDFTSQTAVTCIPGYIVVPMYREMGGKLVSVHDQKLVII